MVSISSLVTFLGNQRTRFTQWKSAFPPWIHSLLLPAVILYAKLDKTWHKRETEISNTKLHSKCKGCRTQGYGPMMRHMAKPLSETHLFRQVKLSTTDISTSAAFLKLLRHQGCENYWSLTEIFRQNFTIERGRSLPWWEGKPVSHQLWTRSWVHYPCHQEPLTVSFTKVCCLAPSLVSSALNCCHRELGAAVSRPGATPGGEGCFKLLTL